MLPITFLNESGDPRLPLPLAVKPRVACRMLSCGTTRLYELLGTGELESYRDGGARMITTRSILARVERLLEASQQNNTPEVA
jgi:hypothetical protein